MNSLSISYSKFLFPIFPGFHGDTHYVFQVLITFYFRDDSICFIIYYNETFLIYHVFPFCPDCLRIQI